MSLAGKIQAAKAEVRFQADTSGVRAGIRQVEKDLRMFQLKSSRIANFGAQLRGLGEGVNRFGRRMALAGTAMSVPFAAASKAVADFDRQLSAMTVNFGSKIGTKVFNDFGKEIRGAANETQRYNRQLLRTKQTIGSFRSKTLGIATELPFTPVQVSRMGSTLAKAGLNPDQVFGKGKQGGLLRSFARAAATDLSGTDPEETTKSILFMLKAFGMLDAESKNFDVQQITNELAAITKASTQANVSFVSLAETLKFPGGLLAGNVKADRSQFKEAIAIASVLSERLADASIAGTSFRGFEARLRGARKDDSVSDALRQFQLTVDDFRTDDGKSFKSAVEIIDTFNSRRSGFDSDQQFRDAIATVFETRQLSGILALIDEGGDKLRKRIEKLSFSGSEGEEYIQDFTDELLNNLGGSIEKTKSNFQTLGIKIGDTFKKEAMGALQGVIDVIQKFAGVVGPNGLLSGGLIENEDFQKNVKRIVLATGAIVALGVAITGLGAVLSTISLPIIALGLIGPQLAGGFGVARKALALLTAGFSGVVVPIRAAVQEFKALQAATVATAVATANRKKAAKAFQFPLIGNVVGTKSTEGLTPQMLAFNEKRRSMKAANAALNSAILARPFDTKVTKTEERKTLASARRAVRSFKKAEREKTAAVKKAEREKAAAVKKAGKATRSSSKATAAAVAASSIPTSRQKGEKVLKREALRKAVMSSRKKRSALAAANKALVAANLSDVFVDKKTAVREALKQGVRQRAKRRAALTAANKALIAANLSELFVDKRPADKMIKSMILSPGFGGISAIDRMKQQEARFFNNRTANSQLDRARRAGPGRTMGQFVSSPMFFGRDGQPVRQLPQRGLRDRLRLASIRARRSLFQRRTGLDPSNLAGRRSQLKAVPKAILGVGKTGLAAGFKGIKTAALGLVGALTAIGAKFVLIAGIVTSLVTSTTLLENLFEAFRNGTKNLQSNFIPALDLINASLAALKSPSDSFDVGDFLKDLRTASRIILLSFLQDLPSLLGQLIKAVFVTILQTIGGLGSAIGRVLGLGANGGDMGLQGEIDRLMSGLSDRMDQLGQITAAAQAAEDARLMRITGEDDPVIARQKFNDAVEKMGDIADRSAYLQGQAAIYIDDLREEAQKLTEQFRTSREVFTEEVGKLGMMIANGLITPSTAGRVFSSLASDVTRNDPALAKQVELQKAREEYAASLRDQAKELRRSLFPQVQLNEEVKGYRDLLKRNLITQAEYNEAVAIATRNANQAEDQRRDLLDQINGTSARGFGSNVGRGGFFARNNANFGIGEKSNQEKFSANLKAEEENINKWSGVAASVAGQIGTAIKSSLPVQGVMNGLMNIAQFTLPESLSKDLPDVISGAKSSLEFLSEAADAAAKALMPPANKTPEAPQVESSADNPTPPKPENQPRAQGVQDLMDIGSQDVTRYDHLGREIQGYIDAYQKLKKLLFSRQPGERPAETKNPAGAPTDFSRMGNFGGFLASGGGVKQGNSYVVGEKGPELFFPTESGHILSNGLSKKVDGMFSDGTNDSFTRKMFELAIEIDKLEPKRWIEDIDSDLISSMADFSFQPPTGKNQNLGGMTRLSDTTMEAIDPLLKAGDAVDKMAKVSSLSANSMASITAPNKDAIDKLLESANFKGMLGSIDDPTHTARSLLGPGSDTAFGVPRNMQGRMLGARRLNDEQLAERRAEYLQGKRAARGSGDNGPLFMDRRNRILKDAQQGQVPNAPGLGNRPLAADAAMAGQNAIANSPVVEHLQTISETLTDSKAILGKIATNTSDQGGIVS